MLKKTQPQLIMLNGHGNDSQVAGQDNEVLLDTPPGKDIVDGRIIYALSCSAARILGHSCIKNGAKAFIGYNEDYIFLHKHPKISHPLQDKRASLFFEPSNLIPISLLKDKTSKEAYSASRQQLRKNIIDFFNSETYNEEIICLPYLLWNYENLALLGNQEASL